MDGGLSAAGFRLCDVTLNLFGVNADNGADEGAATIVNVDLRDRSDVVLFRYRRIPNDDINLAKRDLRIGLSHLFQAWRQPLAWAAPISIKIDNSDVATP